MHRGRGRELQRLLVALAATVLSPLDARAQLATPPGWFSGDVHVHQPDSCQGVSDPARVLDAMPADLDLVAVLIWCSFGRFAADPQAHFRGASSSSRRAVGSSSSAWTEWAWATSSASSRGARASSCEPA